MSGQAPGSGRQPIAVRMARWSATHPWRAIGMWVVFVALCLVAGGVLGTREATDVDLAVGESGRATKMLADAGFDDPASENVLITAKSSTVDADRAADAADAVRARMTALPEVASVGEAVPAPKGGALLVPITMRGDPDTADERVEPLLDATAAVQKRFTDLRVEQVGDASLDQSINERVGEDLAKSEKLSIPITLLILLVAFGAIIAAGVPVLLALSAVAAAMGLSTVASHVFPDTGTVQNVVLLMGLAVGVDYSLFYLKREREERAKGLGHVDAVEIAAATSGHSVVVSAIAVMVSAAGLYVAGEATSSSLGTGTIIVVAVAMLGSLTVLPALLAKLGRWVDRPRVPLLWRLSYRAGTPRLWPALLRPALNRPGVTLVLTLAALTALAWPATNMKLAESSVDQLPGDLAPVTAYKRMTTLFPTENMAHKVVVRAPASDAPRVRSTLEELARRAAASDGFTPAQRATVRVSDDRTVSVVELTTSTRDISSTAAIRSLDKLREELVPATLGTLDGVEYAVGGSIAETTDYTGQIRDRLPWVIAFVLALTLIVMLVTFRSVVIALTAIGVNLVSAMAAFGMLVGVFQYMWAQELLDFRSTGSVVGWIPLLLFVILFGLSMDYHVFVVSRIREAARSGVDIRDAVREGITRSAGVVTSAAVVMVVVFSVFVTLSLVEMKQIGFGLAAAVLLDAVVVRIVLLPSLMTLLGRANWWPGGAAYVHRAGLARASWLT